jgi:PAS domain S-box-containing protein
VKDKVELKMQRDVNLMEGRQIKKKSETIKKTRALLRANEELVVLNRLCKTVTAQPCLHDACNAAVKELSVALELEVAVLFLQEGDELHFKAISPNSSQLQPETMPLHIVGECLCGLAARKGCLICSNNIHRDKRCTWTECKKAGLHSFAAIPLLLGNQHIGVLGVASAGKRDFKQAANFLKTVADQLAICIQNAKLFEQTRAYAAQLEQQIAERQRAEEVLHKSEDRFRALTENTSDWLWEIDQYGVYTYASPKVKDFLGYEPNEIIGKSPFDFMPEDESQRLHQIFNNIVESRKPFTALENMNLHKDGHRIILETSGVPIFSEDGDFLGYRGIDRDITARKQAQEALRASEEKYRLLFENASDAIFVAQDEMIKFPNPQLSQLIGYSSEELTGNPFRNFIHPEDCDIVVERHKRRLQGYDIPKTYSFRAIKKSGEILWVEVSKVFIIWEGRPATLSFLRDITQQKKLEAQLLQAQKMEAIGQLAGGVAHDFNNLLTAIIGYGHLLKNEAAKDDRISSYAGQILSAAERAAILTNDLLTFSRKQIVNLQPVNLNKIIKNMESLLLRVIGENIELTTALIDADLTIMADSSQIDQILMNLATNAQDAMPNGGSFIIRTDRVKINGDYIRAHGYGTLGSYALLSVEDTGIGMDEKIRERIFEPFFTTKEVGKGTGLGLSMVYGIVKQHDGYVNVYSEPGRGTTFKILLPLVQSKVEELKPDTLIKVKGGTETILIGEDETQVRILLKEILSNEGYNIVEAVDGDDAVKVFHKNKDKIHLLILDVIMPRKNGKEAYAEIKKVKPDIKVIFVSGYSSDIIHKKGILEDGLNFISKPVSPDRLLIKVRDVLDK